MTCAIAAAIVHCTGLYTSLSITVQDELHMARTLRAVVCLLADVLATAITIVTSQFAVLHVTGELESRSTLTGDGTFLRFPTDVCAAVILVHAGGSLL